MTLCIISHTEHYKDESGVLKAWGSTVTEINHLLEIFDRIIHVAPLHQGTPPPSSLPYIDDERIAFIPLKPSGGQGLQKLSIVWTAMSNLKKMRKAIQHADIIQFRAPTGMGIYVLPYLKWFNSKPYWVKYAGNWIDPNMPTGNRIQKQWLLKHLEPETQVTYNGNWEDNSQFLSFHNPCYTLENYQKAKLAIDQKSDPYKEGWTLCFVGALNAHKGVPLILEALKQNPIDLPIKAVHFVGDGPDRNLYEAQAKQLKVEVFCYGFLPKLLVHKVLAESDAILLPSKSEGFPKVIGEAMAYGCVPISSNVSCMVDYIHDGENGFLLYDLTATALLNSFKKLSELSGKELHQLRVKNYTFAECFTYTHYNQALQENIINVRL
jgi:glycosyltransferase involved in cell wall biosynthesis